MSSMEEKFFAEARKRDLDPPLPEAGPAPAATMVAPPRSSMTRNVLLLAGVLVLAAAAGLLWRASNLQPIYDEVVASDSRNAGVVVQPRYKDVLSRKVLIFDLISVAPECSQTDVFRAFLQFASRMQDREVETVVLAYRSLPRFKLKGSYFHKLGMEYGTPSQNVISLLRMFPQNVLGLDETAVFEAPAGNAIDQQNKQMDNFAEFNRRWYWDEIHKPAEGED